MKKISALLALFVLFFAGLALANTAIVTSATGSARAQTGTAPARTLRVGDEVRQGDTVVTGPASSVVLKFDDGQVAALTANSRMTVTQYQYNPSSGAGSVLLSLINGGMRAITGLIGRRAPENVAYRAGTATIGIRGTDVTIATTLGNVVVTVTEGAISFTFGDKTITVTAGEGVNARTDGTFQTGAIETILSQLDSIDPGLAAAIDRVQSLESAIQEAAGTPRSGTTREGTSDTTNTPGPGGGGSASPS